MPSKPSISIQLLLAVLFLTLGSNAWAGPKAPIKDGQKLVFTFLNKGDEYQFEGKFDVAADPQVIWNVLTDYNGRSRYVSNTNCHVLQRDGNDAVVDMTVGGGFLFIREEVKGRLQVHEDPFKSVAFDETSRKNFDLYRGKWSFQPEAQGQKRQVTYRLEAKKNKFTPGFVTADILRQSSEDLMTQMKREIEKREVVFLKGQNLVQK